MDIGALNYRNNITIPQNTNSMVNNRDADSFAKTLANKEVHSQNEVTKGIVLHWKNEADAGETAVGSWASVQTGFSTSVYKPDDFSEDNPYYHVKIWKPDGTMEERMVDVVNFNPKSADNFDQYAFSCYLDKEEGMPVWSSFLDRHAKTGDDLYRERDWTQAYKDRAQELFDAGYYEDV